MAIIPIMITIIKSRRSCSIESIESCQLSLYKISPQFALCLLHWRGSCQLWSCWPIKPKLCTWSLNREAARNVAWIDQRSTRSSLRTSLWILTQRASNHLSAASAESTNRSKSSSRGRNFSFLAQHQSFITEHCCSVVHLSLRDHSEWLHRRAPIYSSLHHFHHQSKPSIWVGYIWLTFVAAGLHSPQARWKDRRRDSTVVRVAWQSGRKSDELLVPWANNPASACKVDPDSPAGGPMLVCIHPSSPSLISVEYSPLAEAICSLAREPWSRPGCSSSSKVFRRRS